MKNTALTDPGLWEALHKVLGLNGTQKITSVQAIKFAVVVETTTPYAGVRNGSAVTKYSVSQATTTLELS